MPEPVHKERDWIDIGLKASTPLIVGLVVAWIGIYGDEALNTISHRQQSARLITELQIRREQDESALRKDIFTRALDAFLVDGKPAGGDGTKSEEEMSKQLLRLELLALNFGDSLSLTPLFVEMHKDLRILLKNASRDSDKARKALVAHKAIHDQAFLHRKNVPVFAEKKMQELYNKHEDERRKWKLKIKRLTSLAKRVASSQASALALHGQEKTVIVPLDAFLQSESYKTDDDCDKRASQGSDRLSSNSDKPDEQKPLDVLVFFWPYNEAWLKGKQVLARELSGPLQRMSEDIAKRKGEAYVIKGTLQMRLKFGVRIPSDEFENLQERLGVMTKRYEILKSMDEDLESLEADLFNYMEGGLKEAATMEEVYFKIKEIYEEMKQVVDLGLAEEAATIDGVYFKVRAIYEEVKQVFAPGLKYEYSPLDSSKFIEEWKGLKAKFGEGGFLHFLRNIVSSSEIEKSGLLDLGMKAYIREEKKLRKLEFQDVWRDVELEVSEVDNCLQSLRVKLDLVEKKYIRGEVIDGEDKVTSSFDLDYFNFPTVDNTRLAHNHRFAVVIEEFDTTGASDFGPHVRLALLVFPSEYASLRDRPGMEEVRSLLESAMDFEPGGN